MGGPKRVLVVDDEGDIRDGVSRWLHAAGFELLFAENGQAGVEAATREAPDAILLDVLMPQKDGMETLAELRANKLTVGIPVVMLSANLRDEQRALDAGARFFVQKPYDAKELVFTLKTAINQYHESTHSHASIGTQENSCYEEIASDR